MVAGDYDLRCTRKCTCTCTIHMVDDHYLTQNGEKHMEAGYMRSVSFGVVRVYRGKKVVKSLVNRKHGHFSCSESCNHFCAHCCLGFIQVGTASTAAVGLERQAFCDHTLV